MHRRAILNFKFNGFLKFYFFNIWSLLLMEWLEKVGMCPALLIQSLWPIQQMLTLSIIHKNQIAKLFSFLTIITEISLSFMFSI